MVAKRTAFGIACPKPDGICHSTLDDGIVSAMVAKRTAASGIALLPQFPDSYFPG
jgi:hypothetical protein